MTDDQPDDCQYAFCTADPVTALNFPFGDRWYCEDHAVQMTMDFNGPKDVVGGQAIGTTSADD